MKGIERIHGIHHITAICSAPAVNVSFYEDALGLRLIKQTVNFDDPFTYHLYYGDSEGRPGTILTFFPWEGMSRGKNGAGMVTAIAFEIAATSVDYWLARLARHGVRVSQQCRFGDRVLSFTDPHGLGLELIVAEDDSQQDKTVFPEAGIDNRIRGFHSATALVRSERESETLLTEAMGLRYFNREGNRVRFGMENDEALGRYYDLVVDPEAPVGSQGSGTVHHIAFRTTSDSEQIRWQQTLMNAGYSVSDVRDRHYFKSIYFQEPGGVLFEIATDQPGFSIDERYEELGRSLKLPVQYERMREQIEQRLPDLRGTEFKHEFVAADGGQESGITFVTLHGTGGDERDLIPLARHISEDIAILSPRGRVNEQGMLRFFKRLSPGVFDEEDIIYRANELGDFLLHASSRYGRPLDQLVALGYSNGANMAAALLFIRPELFSRAILLRPMLPLSKQKLEHFLECKEILILRGTKDQVIPAESTRLLIDALDQAGAKVTVFDIDAGHALTETDVELARRWLADRRKSAIAPLPLTHEHLASRQ